MSAICSAWCKNLQKSYMREKGIYPFRAYTCCCVRMGYAHIMSNGLLCCGNVAITKCMHYLP
ncbi:hypothetical protein HMPREF9248_0922 [Fannyhessea vaginae PB189-T1-4]|uniref:Uncharacterized protein n=1 Tax=Fannyhessea vaginae PB189-T1-4 TaxID=866774 RepID=A0ABN0B050_9ACTN|nr:hypothetical protein HMPREF9248_0922 [Fannyhessea vaginae PB189-T1-4]